MTPLELVVYELENQIENGTTKDTSLQRDESEISCTIFSDKDNISKNEWKIVAYEVLNAVNDYNEYCYEIAYVCGTGFTLKEV